MIWARVSFEDMVRVWGPAQCSHSVADASKQSLARPAAEQLLSATYNALRRIAAAKMANERAGHTLQPTALVHEAYLRLLGPEGEERNWNSQGHFFSAAAEAMRRILIEHARKRQSLKRGGDRLRTTLDESGLALTVPDEELLAVHEALAKLEEEDPDLARLVKLRYFAGLSVPETAGVLGISESSVKRSWRCARAWLLREIGADRNEPAKKVPKS